MPTDTRGGPIIWSLRAIPGRLVQMLQQGAPVKRDTNFLQPALMRQKPRRLGGKIAPDVPINLPWNAVGLPSLVDVLASSPCPIHQLLPYPPTNFSIYGVTRDSTGAVLGNCVVDLFDTATDVKISSTTSNATTGAFSLPYASQKPTGYYLVAYKAGAPDLAGTTVSTLTGS